MDNPEELKDFNTWHVTEPYEDFVGPFFFKIKKNKTIAAFNFKKHHMNSIKSLHGGMIMSFADYALFIIGHKYTSKNNYVTISCSTEFLKASFEKGIVYSDGEITKATRSLLFIKGKIYNSELPLCNSIRNVIKGIDVNKIISNLLSRPQQFES